VEIILNTNKELLEAALIKRVEQQWHPNQLVGDIFVKMAPCLKIYTEYIQNFNDALNQIQECKKSPAFIEFCNSAFPKFSFSVVDLPTLLITPIQRIPRYQLLLKDLLKHTWPDHPDFENLNKALNMIVETANFVNQKKMEAENIQKCMAIQATLYGKNIESLLDPHRRFVREGALKEVGKEKRIKQKWLILFNNILVYCEMSKTMSKSLTNKDKGKRGTLNLKDLSQQKLFKYKELYHLERIVEIKTVPDEGLRTNCFTIVFKHGDELSFCAYSKEEKEEWIKDLSECSEEAKQKLATHDEQVTRIAKQRASLTKTLLSEQLMHRTRSTTEDELSKTYSSESFDQLRHLLEEGEVEVASASTTAMAAGRRTEKPNLRDFKKRVATGSRHQSLTVGALNMESIREQQRDADSDEPNGGSPTTSGEKRTRRFVGLKRNSLKQGVGGASKDDLQISAGGSPAPQTRKFATKKNELSGSGSGIYSADNIAVTPTEEPRTRRFAEMRRETWSGERPELSSSGSDKLPDVPASASPTPSPSGNRVRKFASLKRENYKDL